MTMISMLAAVVMAIQNLAPLNHDIESLDKTQTLCLAEAIYHESRGEPYVGRVMVAQTVLNRADKAHNGQICSTLAKKGAFPWWKHRRQMPVSEEAAFRSAVELAIVVQVGMAPPPPFRVFYFFGKSEWRYFNWARSSRRVVIGTHVFLPARGKNEQF